MNALFHAHSGLRYLVLLVAVAAIASLVYSLVTGRAAKTAFAISGAFVGLLDLQVVLGIALVIGGLFPDAVVGHLAMMVFAAVVAHAASIIGKRSSDDRKELAFRLAGIIVSLALIVGGILAIGRSVLGTHPPALS